MTALERFALDDTFSWYVVALARAARLACEAAPAEPTAIVPTIATIPIAMARITDGVPRAARCEVRPDMRASGISSRAREGQTPTKACTNNRLSTVQRNPLIGDATRRVCFLLLRG